MPNWLKVNNTVNWCIRGLLGRFLGVKILGKRRFPQGEFCDRPEND